MLTIMLPVTHAVLLVILAVSLAVTLTGLTVLGLLLRESRREVAEVVRISRALAGLVYQEEEKARALLRDPEWPR